jgi:hypothetical protein
MLKAAILTSALSVTQIGLFGDHNTYSLYRTDPMNPEMRILVAIFDLKGAEETNKMNCMIAAEAIAKQPGQAARHWCEKGRHHK